MVKHTLLNKVKVLAIFTYFISFPVMAAQISSNGFGGGIWSQTFTWQGGIIPGAADTVTILAGDNIFLTAPATAGMLIFEGGATANTLIHSTATDTLTVTGDVLLNGPTANNQTQQWNINSGVAIVGNNIILSTDASGTNTRVSQVNLSTGRVFVDSLVFNNSDGNGDARTHLGISGSGSVHMNGNIDFTGNNGSIDAGSDGRFHFTGSLDQVLKQTGGGPILLHDVYVQKSGGTVFADANIDQSGATQLTGSIYTESGSLDAGIYTIGLAFGEIFSVSNGATFLTQEAGAAAFPTASTISLDTASTVIYNGDVNQTVASLTYGNLTIQNAASTNNRTYTLAGNIIVDGDFSISSTGGFLATVATGTFSISANSSDSFSMTENTILTLSADNFPHQFGTYTIDPLAEIRFDATTMNQTIYGTSSTSGSGITYGLVDLRGGQTGGFSKIASGGLDINGLFNVGVSSNINLNLGSFSHTIAGNWTDNGGSVITVGTSTVTFDGADQSIQNGNFYNVIFSGSGTKTIVSSFNAENDVTIDPGVIADPDGVTMTIAGDWINNGLFTPNAGQDTYFDGAGQNISASDFADLFISGSGTKTASGALNISGQLQVNSNLVTQGVTHVEGALDLNGTLTTQDSIIIAGNVDIDNAASFIAGGVIDAEAIFDVNNGTLDDGGFDHYVAGNWINTGGAVITSTGRWTFDGADQTITRPQLNEAVFSGSGTKTISTSFDFDGSLTVENDVSVTTAVNGTIAGDVVLNGTGSFSHTGNTLTLDGVDQNIGGITVNNLTMAGSGTKTATGNMDINGSLVVNSGFDAASYTHTVVGNWTRTGSFIPGTSTIIFDGGDSNIDNDEIYYNLTLNSTGGASALENGATLTPFSITVNNNLDLVSGEFRIYPLAGTELSIGGDVTIQDAATTGFYFAGVDITIEMGGSFINDNITGSAFSSVDGTEVLDFVGSSSSMIRTNDVSIPNLNINRPDGNLTLDDNLTITGVLTLSGGTITSSSADLLILGSTASYVGGSSGSYINGPMVYTINSTGIRTFPIGKPGKYRPLEFNITTQATAPELQAELFLGSPGGTTDTTTMDTISSVFYYATQVINAGTIDAATVKISVGSGDEVSDLQTTTIARSTSQAGLYSSLGRSAYSGSPSNGSVTSNSYDLTEARDFLLLGFEKIAPVRLAIIDILPNPAVINETFDVTLQAQTVSGAGANVSENTVIDLSRILTGSGTLGGVTSDTIFAGQSQVTIVGVIYGTAEDIQIGAVVTEGENLAADTSDVITVAQAFFSQASGNPATPSNWNTERDGSGLNPSAAYSGLFIIQNGHSMTTTANFSEYDVDIRVENGGEFVQNTGTTEIRNLYIQNGGTVTSNAEIEIASTGSLTINNGGTFILNNTVRLDQAEALFAGTENFADSSNFIVLNMSTTAASINVLAAAVFGNLNFNMTGYANNSSFNGLLTTINGSLTFESTGSGILDFANGNTEGYTLNIGGNFVVSGGTVYLVNANAIPILNIGGDLLVSGGELRLTNAAGDPVLNVSGGLTVSGGTMNLSANNGGISLVNVGGNFTHSTGTISETANGSGSFIFNGTSPQTWTTGGTLTGNAINFTINNQDGVTLAGSGVTIDGTLTLSDGYLNTSDANLLTISNIGTISGGGVSSMINGPMVHSWSTTTATKIYPVGADSIYRPIEITLTSPSSPVIKGEVFNGSSGGSPDDVTVINLSTVRYYITEILSGSAGTNNAQVKLYWGNDDLVSNIPALVVSRSTTQTGVYSSVGQSAFSGDNNSGNLTSELFSLQTGMNFFVLGSVDIDQGLPVALTSFTALAHPGYIDLKWVTASEINNIGFSLERKEASEDAFFTIASYQTDNRLRGQGTISYETQYQYSDSTVAAGREYIYRLIQYDYGGDVHIQQIEPGAVAEKLLPESFKVGQNYPNPFNPLTTIEYSLPAESYVSLIIYNMLGQKVIALKDAIENAGYYKVLWNSQNSAGITLTSGVYFYVFKIKDLNSGKIYNSVNKMILMK